MEFSFSLLGKIEEQAFLEGLGMKWNQDSGLGAC